MTLLVGALSTTSHGTVGNGTQNIQYGAVWTAVATGTATTMSVGLNSTNTGNLVLAIYNSGGTSRLGYTNPFAQAVGTNTQSLVSSVPITSGTQYLLAVETSAFYIDIYNNGGATFSDPYDYITYSSPPPGTMTLGTDWGNGFPSLSANGTTGGGNQPGQFFLSETGLKVPSIAVAMFMPLSWILERRRKLKK